jgi:hypothetical protein
MALTPGVTSSAYSSADKPTQIEQLALTLAYLPPCKSFLLLMQKYHKVSVPWILDHQGIHSPCKCSGHERGMLFVPYTVHGHAHVILSRVYALTLLSDMHTRYIVLGALQFQIRLCICFIQ